MSNNNILEPLLRVAAEAYTNHDSTIGSTAALCLHAAIDKPIVKTSHTVPQCAELALAYKQTQNKLNNQVQALENQLHWADTDAGVKPKSVQEKMAFVELVSPSGMILTDHCRVGLFFQRTHTNYPNHHHAAEELYVVISGHALWTNESNKKPTVKEPGELIHHKSWEAHAMQTNNEPLLAMWCWTGDIAFDQYKMV